ncbi:uncharacterized protein B0I36DRAFT_353380 [Microdochium trichocladiopsis]|uniref:Uncharacterized protein n=1 Tax=Microdochium trichocladiopsis TaxID=1682393 RepID=A0A9P8Y1Q7_9PEZI|nr:uncharacterized protein B0I36DRAFT_353380 [Microdochium trichocladiopsis]KAH7025236.1 hypothetical protein B0I36DRAFT_353380 [Microdochium trichocladiopsis]
MNRRFQLEKRSSMSIRDPHFPFTPSLWLKFVPPSAAEHKRGYFYRKGSIHAPEEECRQDNCRAVTFVDGVTNEGESRSLSNRAAWLEAIVHPGDDSLGSVAVDEGEYPPPNDDNKQRGEKRQRDRSEADKSRKRHRGQPLLTKSKARPSPHILQEIIRAISKPTKACAFFHHCTESAPGGVNDELAGVPCSKGMQPSAIHTTQEWLGVVLNCPPEKVVHNGGSTGSTLDEVEGFISLDLEEGNEQRR